MWPHTGQQEGQGNDQRRSVQTDHVPNVVPEVRSIIMVDTVTSTVRVYLVARRRKCYGQLQSLSDYESD